MKAKDYYEKYKNQLSSGNNEEENKALNALFLELYNEIGTLAKARGVKTNTGFVSCIREINDKWNALCRLGPELHLIRDGFKALCIQAMPEIKHYF